MHDPVARRRLGRYDTPEKVALPFVRWGLRGRPGRILDPSFGGCNFLQASLLALAEAGARHPGHFVYGIDVATDVREHRLRLIDSGVPADQLVIADFFTTGSRQVPLVDLIVGNPPYIRHHWFQEDSRERAVAALERQNVRLPGRANAWAYFLVHAGGFLREGGRMALLLPGAVCFTDYAADALKYISARAGRCTLLRIGKRLFSDAREDTVALLAEDWGAGPCDLMVHDVDSFEDLERWLGNGTAAAVGALPGSITALGGRELAGPVGEAWRRALESPRVCRLNDLARIRIGVVTGANAFFVRSAHEARTLQAGGSRSAPIVTRGRWLAGLEWTGKDQRRIEKDGFPSRLILAHSGRPPRGALFEWVEAGKEAGIPDRLQCSRRRVWYALSDHAVPDAFLHYMGEGPPRVVLNRVGALVTNAVHRVWWETDDISPEAIAVATCTSLFALACELDGRTHGGGVLKVEPGAAGRLPIASVPDAAAGLAEVDALLRSRRLGEARALADEIVLGRGLGLCQETITVLREAAARFAIRRRSQELIF